MDRPLLLTVAAGLIARRPVGRLCADHCDHRCPDRDQGLHGEGTEAAPPARLARRRCSYAQRQVQPPPLIAHAGCRPSAPATTAAEPPAARARSRGSTASRSSPTGSMRPLAASTEADALGRPACGEGNEGLRTAAFARRRRPRGFEERPRHALGRVDRRHPARARRPVPRAVTRSRRAWSAPAFACSLAGCLQRRCSPPANGRAVRKASPPSPALPIANIPAILTAAGRPSPSRPFTQPMRSMVSSIPPLLSCCSARSRSGTLAAALLHGPALAGTRRCRRVRHADPRLPRQAGFLGALHLSCCRHGRVASPSRAPAVALARDHDHRLRSCSGSSRVSITMSNCRSRRTPFHADRGLRARSLCSWSAASCSARPSRGRRDRAGVVELPRAPICSARLLIVLSKRACGPCADRLHASGWWRRCSSPGASPAATGALGVGRS